ncbi:MAG: YciI family protein [Anaerolineales bacterium]
MKYMLLMYANESLEMNTPEEQQAVSQDVWFALMKEMKDAGALITQNGLAPTATATTVRVREGKPLITDGPFAETHEQLGGFFLLDCKDLDEALRWAEKIPHALYGSVEVRPLWSEV